MCHIQILSKESTHPDAQVTKPTIPTTKQYQIKLHNKCDAPCFQLHFPNYTYIMAAQLSILVSRLTPTYLVVKPRLKESSIALPKNDPGVKVKIKSNLFGAAVHTLSWQHEMNMKI